MEVEREVARGEGGVPDETRVGLDARTLAADEVKGGVV